MILLTEGVESPYQNKCYVRLDEGDITFILPQPDNSRLRRQLRKTSWSVQYRKLPGGMLSCYVVIPREYENQGEDIIAEYLIDITIEPLEVQEYFTKRFEEGETFFSYILVVDSKTNEIIRVRMFGHNNDCHNYMVKVFQEQREVEPTRRGVNDLPSLRKCVELCEVRQALKTEE